ncbi:MAG: phosphoglucomutase [Proteobacteria bacterium]|nr:phosphoglucomutase [Pseudomonadota bacterium]MBU1232127.1 phosphoglucomutase [Pseudomonadota bacterium]MBU1417859.1 phosphoglucomutase [Pseudomonadota bacterium]MBU1453381.1 phosphoglucomutase [Pseudomonadota bacterium]
MSQATTFKELYHQCNIGSVHSQSDYFSLIRELVRLRNDEGTEWQRYIDQTYALVMDEIITNAGEPVTPVKFGTSGWRGMLGKDLFLRSVSFVTAAILDLYLAVDNEPELAVFLGVSSLGEARKRGCVLGFDNRFGGEILAGAVTEVLRGAGFTVHYAGESTTGVLSAAVLELNAAFSINLTPSHNPLEYGGYKYNAADAGPAAAELTGRITARAREIIAAGSSPLVALDKPVVSPEARNDVHPFDALSTWKQLVRRNKSIHGVNYDDILDRFAGDKEVVVVIDSVHGASRIHIDSLFEGAGSERLVQLRANADPTFNGIAPEPSSVNIAGVIDILALRKESLKVGAIIDPDGDRIRFTDGTTEISMNQFGAMAYHFLHEEKGKRGMVAKTVATSNLANRLAEVFGEETYEPRVGFKEFKPVIGKALVCFEESDGISIIGHTPEKDAYIGLLLALDMVLSRRQNLGDYLAEIEGEFGAYYPDRDGLLVSSQGKELTAALSKLGKYDVGSTIRVGDREQVISQVIAIDGRKMILEDGSWLMIRPSGTEPKVRFYVESRTASGTAALVQAARVMLEEIGLV